MANTFTQLQIHFVFAVKRRHALICNTWKSELHKFITGAVQQFSHKVLQINSVSDHIHILIRLDPDQSISRLMQVVKSESSNWINSRRLCNQRFSWQEGFGAFSCSRNRVPDMIRYIQNQEIHHREISFTEEYKSHLREEGIDFDEKYIFHEPL